MNTKQFKFRVWDGKKMIYLADERNDTSIVFNEWGWEAIDHFTGKWETLTTSWDNPDSVLMQFTGLHDKDGKEIYQGDILQGVSANPFSLGDEIEHEVMWGRDSWHIKGTLFSIQEFFNYCNNDVVVFGNIYEKK